MEEAMKKFITKKEIENVLYRWNKNREENKKRSNVWFKFFFSVKVTFLIMGNNIV